MDRRHSLRAASVFLSSAVLLLALFIQGLFAASPRRPNIVMAFINDMGWGDSSCFGTCDAQTSQVDTLAASSDTTTNVTPQHSDAVQPLTEAHLAWHKMMPADHGPTLGSQSKPEPAKRKIVFIHGSGSHGYGGHAYGPAFRMLARMLNENIPAVNAMVCGEEWPKDEAVLNDAAAIMLGSDGGMLVNKYAAQLKPLMDRGVGLGCIHYTLDPGRNDSVQQLIQWIGGSYEQHWSVNPHWEANFTAFPDHPVARGLKPFKVSDEWYYHMRFVADMKRVTPILQAVPPDSTRDGPDGAHSGNPSVRARKGMSEVVGWVYERPDGGRGFGFTGMHTHWSWAQDSYRTMVLNALVWIAGAEVPTGGVPSQTPTLKELETDLAQPRPSDFDAEGIRSLIEKMNMPRH